MSSIEELQLAIKKQGDVVRDAKASKLSKQELEPLISKLKQLKLDLEKATKAAGVDLSKAGKKEHRVCDPVALDGLLKRRYFIAPSFSIYGGVAGLFDFGPPGCALKSNFIALWRKHFVVEENMLEIHTPCVTPMTVLETSGHCERFTDLMVTDVVTGEFFRADKVATAHIEELLDDVSLNPDRREDLNKMLVQVESLEEEELYELFKKEGIKSEAGNEFSRPKPFNLMFATSIGPSGTIPAFLRPETAQGIFVNFRKLLEFNQSKMPFAGACVGQAFRNEIAPRLGLLRVREFEMAEIEHFVNPEDKSHTKFDQYKDYHVRLYSRDSQLGDRKEVDITLGDAVEKGIIANQTLGYFIARTQLFMLKIGVNKDHLRFRQHLRHEMAHYATDCWDCELEMSHGWIECVGLADRACFDLSRHMEVSKVDLVATEVFSEPRMEDVLEKQINKGIVGKSFRKKAKIVMGALEKTDDTFAQKLEADGKNELVIEGEDEPVVITKEMVSFKHVQKKVSSRKYIPHVIEPSFGIGRIIAAVFEHSFYTRENDTQRGVLRFRPIMAPFKCSLLPLSGQPQFTPILKDLSLKLSQKGIAYKLDDSGQSVGKRYARTDEIGVPFGLTVDFQSVQDNTVTLRERDTMKQVRISVDEVVDVIDDMCEERTTWNTVLKQYPEFSEQKVDA